jgi:hypothetical protein
MKKTILYLLIVVLSFSISKAQTATDIINKYINAMGGKDKLLSIKNVYMEGSMDANGSQLNIKYWIINKKSVRYEYTVNGMTSYNIITNDSGWVFSPMMGQKQAEPMTPALVRSSQPELDPEGLLLNYNTNGYKVDLKGKDDVDGTPAFKINEKITDSLTNIYYIDTATYYILRITTKATVDGKQIDMSRDLSNYQKTPDGYTFPMSMGLGMMMGGQVKFTSVKVNTDIDPNLFKPKR